MNRRKTAVLAGLILAAAAFVAAEPALDEVVQAGRFVFYRDHADPHKYYYVPDAPRLATQRDGTPEFTFIKYTKTDGETKGGICHFLVTWGYSSAELSTAESALQGKDPEARIAGPVPFKEGTFRVISATAGEGGLFTRRIVGEGKAPVMPGQKAAVSIALTEEGASLLWESFHNPTSDISVQFIMKFPGVTPAFQAKLKVNWDKVYQQHDIRLHAEAQLKVVKLEADVRAILEELRQQGAIQLEVVGENQDMQKMLDAVYAHLLAMMCDKVPTGAADAGKAQTPATPVKKVTDAALRENPSRFDVVPAARWLEETASDYGQLLRGGPTLSQEQQTESPCDAAAQARWKAAYDEGSRLYREGLFLEAAEKFKEAMAACPLPINLYYIGASYDRMKRFTEAEDYYVKFIAAMGDNTSDERRNAEGRVIMIVAQNAAKEAEAAAQAATQETVQAERQAKRQAAQSKASPTADQVAAGDKGTAESEQQTTAPATQTSPGKSEQALQDKLAQSQTSSKSSTEAKPSAKTTADSTQAPPAKPGTKPGTKTETKPGTKPEAKPGAKSESQPGIKIQLGYTFKQTKLTGQYEVDMRKRLREDREMVMSGNIGGIYQKFGEDKRFFSIISLDDPTFEERTIEVILDGQDSEDFKNYVNSVSVLFRKSRFSGPQMTGEVKFFEQQFAERGNRLSFKYGRLNEASTEWLDYEYCPKWSFYGGVEWEGEWTKTSDSVLTLSSPCQRRTLEISVAEDNILKSNIKALAIQIRHRIFGKEITKEVVINYDKGDPLQSQYTYLHEEGSPRYSYRIIWLFTDGREVPTEWLPRESPFIFAVYANK